MSDHKLFRISAVTLLASLFFTAYAVAEKKYDPGVTDIEIKIGNL